MAIVINSKNKHSSEGFKPLNIKYYLALLSLLIPMLAQGGVPHTFVSDTPANASEVNENFNVVASDIDFIANGGVFSNNFHMGSSDFNETAYGLSKIISVSCPDGEIILTAGAYCATENTNFDTTNLGVLSVSIQVSVSTYVANCLAVEADPLKSGPGITVSINCSSFGNNDPESTKRSLKAAKENVSMVEEQRPEGEMDAELLEVYHAMRAALAVF
ncbi:MAG: hypothetical protein ACJAZT_001683 [Gammaproteobacteria bacterium]|jgi:hypothetical protein